MKKFRMVERITRFGNLEEIKEYVIQKRRRGLFWRDHWVDYKMGSCWNYDGRIRAVFHNKRDAQEAYRRILIGHSKKSVEEKELGK